MYLVVNTEVLFPESNGRKGFNIKSISSFKVESTWQSLTSTCEIVIAKKLFFAEKQHLNDMINAGDRVILRGGYNGNTHTEFSGYVSEILDDIPVKLMCEVNM